MDIAPFVFPSQAPLCTMTIGLMDSSDMPTSVSVLHAGRVLRRCAAALVLAATAALPTACSTPRVHDEPDLVDAGAAGPGLRVDMRYAEIGRGNV